MIRTQRLLMRRARRFDLHDLHAVFAQPQAMRYWSRPPYETLEDTRAFLEGMIAAGPPEADEFVVEREGRVIGKAGMWRRHEIGFILHPDQWGQGIGHEALSALVRHLFAAHGMDALTAEVDPRNARCLRLLARLGFEETGRAQNTLRWAEEWCHSIYLALPRPTGGADATDQRSR
ncbi:GNAT family N-acetyltransferase [Rhodobacter sp. CZR27]|uniref:GNAT family N-acetyltransferase n=1 Tax=Rhodobacter sp. CZR27 TaxID=2033869 RepID=UPI000BBEC310|nr:GNAT family N-acetyltransferase [Rhodobacter sp. CZR27]